MESKVELRFVNGLIRFCSRGRGASGVGALREGIKQFDLNHPDFFRHQPRRRELFKKLYKSGATEDEYVKANQEIVKPNGGVYSRSRLWHEYRRLQRIYDFFSSS